MKHVIFGVGLATMMVLVITAVMIVSGKDVRENEMDKALNTAVEQAFEQVREKGGYKVSDSQELIADFSKELLLHISSDSSMKMEVLSADAKTGVLDVKLTETYRTAKGKEKQTSCRKTVLLEDYDQKAEYHIVTFMVNEIVQERYSIYKGNPVILPEEPSKEGVGFKGWKDTVSGEMLQDGMTVEEDMTFEAVFE